jgi:ribosomal protein L11 methyltransferase
MKWARISVETSRESADALSNLLLEMGSGGVQVEDDNSDRVSVTAYFPPDDMIGERVSKITALLQSLREMSMDVGIGRVTMESVNEQDWSESWKEFFKPLHIGERILVHPSWEEVSESPSRDILIQIDPEMAFGTGGHSTTKLCLELLESVLKCGERVADVGAGSGILSIAAVKLGAREVVAVDVDERASVVARENFQRNDVAARIHVICGDGLSAVKGRYDLIVSNISTKIILSMIPDFRSYLNDDGRLILSGILEREAPEARNALGNSGFMVLGTRYDEEWMGIVAKLPGSLKE